VSAAMDHIRSVRLFEVAEKDVRLTRVEVEHMEKCDECVNAFAKEILRSARSRARNKKAKAKAAS